MKTGEKRVFNKVIKNKSGETLELIIKLKNISPESNAAAVGLIDTMYENLKKVIIPS